MMEAGSELTGGTAGAMRGAAWGKGGCLALAELSCCKTQDVQYILVNYIQAHSHNRMI